MKKSLFIIASAALVLSSCAEDSLRSEIKGEEQAISFATFAQKATRAENSTANYSWNFYDHHNDFAVWGYKNTSETAVFNNTVVAFSSTSSGDCTYSPARYWDKAATKYEFYAAAPADANWTFTPATASGDQKDGSFTTTSTLVGTNITASSDYAYVQSFKNASGDVDKMIAEAKTVNKAQFSQKVDLLFCHILSRLNVAIKKDQVLDSKEVIMKSLTVKLLAATGTFTEASSNANNAASGDHSRWVAASGAPVEYTALANTEVSSDARYVLQSLVIPQDAAFESIALDGSSNEVQPYFELIYTIKDASGDAEEFKTYYNLANAFGVASGDALKFNEGWQNTLYITLKPDVIEFCAMVAEWADNMSESIDIR